MNESTVDNGVDRNVGGIVRTTQKILFNKPEIYKGDSTDSLESFLGHMDLYIAQIPEKMKLNVDISFLGGHAFDWYKFISKVEQVNTWASLKNKLQQRFQPINKSKIARDKLARWKQLTSVEVYNESFLKIIIDIQQISTDEVIDRYMRGHKTHISKELCTRTYTSLTELMSHALSIEASKASFSKASNWEVSRSDPVPMDVSNSRLKLHQKHKDKKGGACYICQKPGCHSYRCPERPNSDRINANHVDLVDQGKDHSQ